MSSPLERGNLWALIHGFWRIETNNTKESDMGFRRLKRDRYGTMISTNASDCREWMIFSMHLSTISLYGFKSFGQDTRIVLSPGITVIVGPNGGGKSNVIDAIRWALGEQRVKELRAERWDDLLHVGGKGQRAKLAEVVLTFDNHDGEMEKWPEVLTVTRRYYLSGDSEYLLNGRTCRLKDVVDLFLDSGVGRFNYAVIGQGRVDEALLMKPRERLEQLEEAAGVSRYKVRRKETLQHLGDVQKNLMRLTDLMAEVRHQQELVHDEALREQAYLTMQHEHAALLARYQYTQYVKAMHDRHEWQTALDTIRTQRVLLQQETADVNKALQGVEEERVFVESQLAQQQERVRQLEQESFSLSAQLARLEAEWQGYQHESEGLQGQIRVVTEQMGTMGDEEGPSMDDLADAQKAWDMARQRLADYEHAVHVLRAQRDQAQTALEEAQRRLQQSERQLARVEGILQAQTTDQALAQLGHLEEERKTLHQALEANRRSLAQLAQSLKDPQARYAASEAEARRLQSESWELEARIKALRTMEQEQQAVPAPVRAVLRAAEQGQLSGIVGTVASVLDIAASYRLALDVAMGAAAHHLITETEHHARQVVEWLKAHKAGRVTLLPLDQIRPSLVPDRDQALEHQLGVHGWALAMVTFHPAFFPAISHVLGRVLVLESLTVAPAVGRQHQFRYKMVTLDGQVVLAGGAISGGSDRRQGPGVSERITPLANRLTHVKALYDRQEADRALAHQQVSQIREDMERIQAEDARIRLRLDQIEHLLAGLSGLGTHDPKVLAQDVKSVRSRVIAAEQNFQDVQAQWQEAAHRMSEAQALVLEAKQRHEILKHQWDLRERAVAEKMRITQQHGGMEARMHDIQTKLDVVHKALDDTRHKHEQTHAALSQQRERLAQDRATLTALGSRVSQLRARQAAMDAEERKIAQRMAYLEQQLAKSEARWDGYEAGAEEVLSDQELGPAKLRIEALQKEMDQVGPVQPGVFALYTQLGERLSYLENEYRDVQLAKDEVQATLEQIDRDVNTRLEETAGQVERAFQEACRALIGGEGGFRWTAGEEPGVELWIKPPGKKPSTMTLLSGGEKALGGIAWLFALLAVRPSPFVVLDEVEAALDEANAQRVAHYIKNHHGTTQYVIVTHHKSTMVIADGLWGVAGDGQGRSRLISVKLDQNAAVAEG